MFLGLVCTLGWGSQCYCTSIMAIYRLLLYLRMALHLSAYLPLARQLCLCIVTSPIILALSLLCVCLPCAFPCVFFCAFPCMFFLLSSPCVPSSPFCWCLPRWLWRLQPRHAPQQCMPTIRGPAENGLCLDLVPYTVDCFLGVFFLYYMLFGEECCISICEAPLFVSIRPCILALFGLSVSESVSVCWVFPSCSANTQPCY